MSTGNNTRDNLIEQFLKKRKEHDDFDLKIRDGLCPFLSSKISSIQEA